MINFKKHFSSCQSVINVIGDLPENSLGFCHDTRAYKHPSFFVAYPGSKYNPVEHIASILDQGCPVVIYEDSAQNSKLINEYSKNYSKCCFVKVNSAVGFTQEISSLHTKEWQKGGGYLFAISGSNGKTTHKEMLSFILSYAFPGDVESTQKNNNNHLGVPFTLLQIKANTKVCILELGSNHPGEIEVLCNIAQPQGGLVTNIGATHLEFFDTLENVFQEEGYLFEHLNKTKPKGLLFFKNIDDQFLKTLPDIAESKSFSSKIKSADYSFEITPPQVNISHSNKLLKIKNEFIAGAHNYSNLATAFIIALNLFPDQQDSLVNACSEFKPTFNRSQWQKILDRDVFLDAYNANPSSMKIALEGFFDELTRRNISHSKALLILGDMNELGTNSDSFHQDVGDFLKRWPTTKVVFVGRFASQYVKGRGEGREFTKVSEINGEKWRELTNDATHVFIKGSRSLQLESLLAIT